MYYTISNINGIFFQFQSTKSSFKGRIRNMLGGLSKSKGGKYSGNYSFSNDLNKNPKVGNINGYR